MPPPRAARKPSGRRQPALAPGVGHPAGHVGVSSEASVTLTAVATWPNSPGAAAAVAVAKAQAGKVKAPQAGVHPPAVSQRQLHSSPASVSSATA
jgi:hypothetical protein